MWLGGASQVGCRPSTEASTGSLWPSLVAEYIIYPTACDPGFVSICTKSEVPGTSTDVVAAATILAQVWSTGAGAMVYAPCVLGRHDTYVPCRQGHNMSAASHRTK